MSKTHGLGNNFRNKVNSRRPYLSFIVSKAAFQMFRGHYLRRHLSTSPQTPFYSLFIASPSRPFKGHHVISTINIRDDTVFCPRHIYKMYRIIYFGRRMYHTHIDQQRKENKRARCDVYTRTEGRNWTIPVPRAWLHE